MSKQGTPEACAVTGSNAHKYAVSWGQKTANSLWHNYVSMGVDFTGKRLLDFGCAWGYLCLLALDRGTNHAVGVDIHPDWEKIEDKTVLARDGLVLVAGDLLNLECLQEERFDVIVSSGTLFLLNSEYLDQVLKWFYDHLNPGGESLLRTRCITARSFNDLGSRLTLPGAQLLFSRRIIDQFLVNKGYTDVKSHIGYTGATWIMACRAAGFDVINVKRDSNTDVVLTAAAHKAKTHWLDPKEVATSTVTLYLRKPVQADDLLPLRKLSGS